MWRGHHALPVDLDDAVPDADATPLGDAPAHEAADLGVGSAVRAGLCPQPSPASPLLPSRTALQALAWAALSSKPPARSEHRDVPVHRCHQSHVLSWAKGSPQDFVPVLTRPWLPLSLNPPAPLRPGLQTLSFSLGHQERPTSQVLGGAPVGVEVAMPPTQLPLSPGMPLSAFPTQPQEIPGQGVAEALGTATTITGVMPRKPGRSHHPKSKQLQSTRQRDTTIGAAEKL